MALHLESLAETRRAGLALGGSLPPRALVLLRGPMGAGKTTLAKAICEGLGIAPAQVISPTYTLVNIYPLPPPGAAVYHVDLFRIEDPDALLELDRNDWVNPDGVTLIEWPEVALALLAGDACLGLSLSVTGDDTRRLEAAGEDSVYGAALRALDGAAARLGGAGGRAP